MSGEFDSIGLVGDLWHQSNRRSDVSMNGSLQLFQYPGGIVRLSFEKCATVKQLQKTLTLTSVSLGTVESMD
jgi:hypothetical protein